jgi:hypothetical protein
MATSRQRDLLKLIKLKRKERMLHFGAGLVTRREYLNETNLLIDDIFRQYAILCAPFKMVFENADLVRIILSYAFDGWFSCGYGTSEFLNYAKLGPMWKEIVCSMVKEIHFAHHCEYSSAKDFKTLAGSSFPLLTEYKHVDLTPLQQMVANNIGVPNLAKIRVDAFRVCVLTKSKKGSSWSWNRSENALWQLWRDYYRRYNNTLSIRLDGSEANKNQLTSKGFSHEFVAPCKIECFFEKELVNRNLNAFWKKAASEEKAPTPKRKRVNTDAKPKKKRNKASTD